MLIPDPAIMSLGWENFSIAWSGVAGKTVRVFVNGLLAIGPQLIATADKSIQLNLAGANIIEVHENDAIETVLPIQTALSRKPLVWWTSRTGALEYRIYSGAQLLGFVRHNASLLHHEFQVTQDLRQDGGAWAGLRVEAITAHGRESVRPEFKFYAPGIPLQPTGVNVTGGAGVFTIALEISA